MSKNSVLIVTALTAASGGMVLGLSPVSFGSNDAPVQVSSPIDWQPPSLDDLGLGHSWTAHVELETGLKQRRVESPAPTRPPDALMVENDGEVIGWVVPDRARVQAMMAYELEQAEVVLAERARRAMSRPSSASASQPKSVNSTTARENRSLRDEPRLRLFNRSFTGTTYRKPAWLEAWGRTLDRLDRQRTDRRRAH